MNPNPVVAYIGLGSNLDNPRAQLLKAFEELGSIPRTSLERVSSLYLSQPLGPQNQPDYINAVARLITELAPLRLLDELQAIERAHQRVRETRWGPRTLDLDLLLYGDQQIGEPRLTVPHPGMHRREFVLVPLAEIAPQLQIPGRGPIESLLVQCQDLGLTRL